MLNINLSLNEMILPTSLALSVLALLLLYVLRLRNYKLPIRYAAWQSEAQEIESVTHDALVAAGSGYPSISIIIPVGENDPSPSELLDSLYAMDYSGKYEVIIADMGQNDKVKDVYKQYTSNHNHLRYTFIPHTSRNIELRKLAITLGIKAARGEWAIVISPNTIPKSNAWLKHYAQNLTEDRDFVEAYYNYADDDSLNARRAILERVGEYTIRLRALERNVLAGCGSSNWAMRKSWFMENKGFADSLPITFGEESIMVNRHASAERSCLLCSPKTRLVENVQDSKQFAYARMKRSEIRHRLTKDARRLFCIDGWASMMVYLYALSLLFYIGGRLYSDLQLSVYTQQCLYADITCLLLIVLGLTYPVLLIRRGLEAFGERKYGAYVYWFALMKPFYNAVTYLHRMAHKQDFIRKYI